MPTTTRRMEGIYRVDLSTGAEELVFSLAEIAAIPDPMGPVDEAFHYFEVVVINPSGTRFLFMDRFNYGGGSWTTRVFTADIDGDDLFMLTDQGTFSHITWMDDTNIVVYAPRHDGYAIYADQVGFVDVVLPSPRDGHETFLPGNEWLLSDTYPDVGDYQHPFLYHLPSNEVFSLAHLHQPSIYSGSDRCDNHPRQSRDGRRVVVDSAHESGRQLYMIEIGDILDAVL
jgi:hypothetical protein